MGRSRAAARLRTTVKCALLAVAAVLLLAPFAAGTLYEGSLCVHEASQMRGVCKLLPYCSWAVKERRSELYPQTCSFIGYLPVVCCPFTRTHDPPHLPLRPLRPLLPAGGDLDPTLQQVVVPAGVDVVVGGPLGPLPPAPPQADDSGKTDDLQQEAGSVDRLDIRLGDRLGQVVQLGDGSAAFLASMRAAKKVS